MPAPEDEDVEIVMEISRKMFGPITGEPKKGRERGPVTPSGSQT